MKHTIYLLLVFATCTTNLQAQQTINAEQVILQRSALTPKRLSQLQWIPGSTDFVYMDTVNSAPVIMLGNSKGELKDWLKLSEINSALKAIDQDTVSKWPAIAFKSKDVFTWKSGESLYTYNVSQHKLKRENVFVAPVNATDTEAGVGTNMAYVVDNNIYVAQDFITKQITSDGNYNLVYGRSAHRDEFGITKGLFWSQDGSKLAFYRMDQSMVTDYPMLDLAVKPAGYHLNKYPFAGGASHHVTVGIYDLASGRTVYLKTGLPAEQYLSNIAWRPDNKSLYIAIINRDQNHMKLNEYNVSTGEFVQTLFEEKNEKYIEPRQPMRFVNGKPDQFLWMSRRDGFDHVYLYDVSGKLIRQLTKGKWEVDSVVGVDPKGERMIVQYASGTGINRSYCSVNLKDGKAKLLTPEVGVHSMKVHPSTLHFLDYYSSLNNPGITVLRDANGKVTSTINKSKNPLEKYKTGTVRIIPLKGNSGDTLWSRIVLPVGFDSTKKYPVVVYVYGGPHVQLVNNSWMGNADLSFQDLAANGCIVFTLDSRGTSERGLAFEQSVYRQLGKYEMEDQLTGVKYLKSLSYVDSTRLGIYGWSYGGFMTISLMTRYPGIFKVAVAGGPVIDWSMYEVMYTERYMDTPQQNPEGYKVSELTQYVGNLKGNLLVIHGTGDTTVVWQQSLNYIRESVNAKVQVDYMAYPGHDHNVRGKDRAHLMRKMYDYILGYL